MLRSSNSIEVPRNTQQDVRQSIVDKKSHEINNLAASVYAAWDDLQRTSTIPDSRLPGHRGPADPRRERVGTLGRLLQGKGLDDAFGSIARRGKRRWLAEKLSSLAPQLHKQASRGDIAGITPDVFAAAPFDPTGMRG